MKNNTNHYEEFHKMTEKRAKEFAVTARIIGVLHLLTLAVSVWLLSLDNKFEAAFCLGLAHIFQVQANHLVERSYRLKGF